MTWQRAVVESEQPWQSLRVIVTAAASGIGREVAEAFAAAGARVHICDLDGERLADCEARMAGVTTSLADVSRPEQVDAFIAEAIEHLGGVDVLVNNAGIAGPTAPVESITTDDWNSTMAVNINGQFYCTRLIVPHMKAQRSGSIINISSSAGLMGYPRRSPYAASKWAVIGFTKTLAMELGEFNIRANAICPGPVEGDRMDRVIAAEASATNVPPAHVRKGYLRQSSMRTFINRRDVADTILFLCSPAGDKISGQAISIDGFTETLRNR